MSDDVMAKLDLLIGMVRNVEAQLRDVQADQRVLKDAMAVQGERIARMEGRLDEQSRLLIALVPTQLAAAPRPAA